MKTRVCKFIFLAVLINSGSGIAQSLTQLDAIHFVSDMHASMPATSGKVYANDTDILRFDTVDETADIENIIGQIDHAGIDGYHNTGDGCGDALFSLDNSAIIASTAMMPADVFTASGTKVLDYKLAGIPNGINVNAISRELSTCDLILSIDSTTTLNGLVFKPDDLIKYQGGTNFSLYQATALGVNIDALHILSSTRVLLSTGVTATLADIEVRDESVFEIDSINSFQLLAFEPLVYDESWVSANINGLWVENCQSNEDIIYCNGFE